MATRSVNTLIDRAYRLINIKSDDRNLTGDQTTEGLDCLNVLIDQLSGVGLFIPSFTIHDFSLVIDQRDYAFSVATDGFTITSLSHVSIIENGTLYPVDILSDSLYYERNYHATSGRPSMCFLTKYPEESKLTFYQSPNKAYSCSIKGKFKISDQELNTDLEDIPPYMFFYLEYALGRMLNTRYPSSSWSAMSEDYYKQAKNDMMVSNDYNLDLNGTTVFQSTRYVTDLSALV